MEQRQGEMSAAREKLETLMKSMEVLLTEVEQLRSHCTHWNLELSRHITELRLENRELTEKYDALAQELQEALETIEDLQDTKYALDAKERQAEKLNRQL
ncbi:hypothetical protein NFI96_006118 [Prochilodus magdalenae]|nr:hypothetical protein NFI96_006118 [Prochilodus magdalenae]